MEEKMQGALEGVRVLDLSRVLAGPWAAQALADLGADVIKVENPNRKDDTRVWGPPFLEEADLEWDAAYYFCTNRNKKAIAVDFSAPEGVEIIKKLAAKADIVVENFKVGALAKYGLDYISLKSINPKLIYCSITGFGQTGPYKNRGGYDFLVQGMSGLMSITGSNGPHSGPTKVGIPASDLFCGLYATISILAALNYRHQTGEGQYIDCALLDTQMAVMSNQAMNYLVGGKVPTRLGNAHPNVVPYRDFKAKDQYILVACGGDRQFRSLCHILNREDLLNNAQYSSNSGRNQARDTLETELAETITQWNAADLLRLMDKYGVPGGPINTIAQSLADEHVISRGLLHEVARESGAKVKLIGFPVKLSATPAQCRITPPRFGQDTKAVLSNELGMSDEQINQYIAQKVIL